MCFSAGASFGAGVVLSVVGVAAIRKAKAPSQMMFASIPLIFAVQQITEGFLWVSLTNPEYASLQQVATYNFLFFAQVVWPVWVPLAIMKLESKDQRRMFGKIIVGIGAMVSLYLAYCLVTYPVGAQIIGYHISYRQDYPLSLSLYSGMFYIIATIIPPFVSRVRRMWMLGIAVLSSYIITAILYTDYIISVWCFFASIISIAIYVIMFEFKNSDMVILKSSESGNQELAVT